MMNTLIISLALLSIHISHGAVSLPTSISEPSPLVQPPPLVLDASYMDMNITNIFTECEDYISQAYGQAYANSG